MRLLYKEGDLISAEIQNISTDGFISLHTRSLKYGTVDNLCLYQTVIVIFCKY
jgi:exosome complex RNA-binding protein Rrp4